MWKQNRYGHPHLETIHRLQTYRTKIYRTDRSGAIIFSKEEMVENLQKKGILSKAIERDAKNMKKILEDIKTNTYERFYLFYGEEKYMISQMKNQLKKALVSEDDTMNYSYFEGKRADAIEIVELAKTLPFLVIIGF